VTPTRGAVAAGHQGTADAATWILSAGGNAIDAAVGAALAASVCEPLLTGPGGGGLMTIRDGSTGRVVVLDFFSSFPGLDDGLLPREFLALAVNYGPTTQHFHAGRGAVAVPGVLPGLHAAWKRFGALDRPSVAAPAVRLAREGWVASDASEVVFRMLRPITSIGADSREAWSPEGRHLAPGDLVRSPAMADALELFGDEGCDPFVTGHHAQALLKACGPPHGSLGPDDLAHYRVVEREPLVGEFGGTTLYVPPPPCAGGALVLFGLELLDRLPDPRSPVAEARLLSAVMAETECVRREGWDTGMFMPGAAEGLLDTANLARHARRVIDRLDSGGPPPVAYDGGPRPPGNTTHLSVVDEHGNACAYTSSNGETCGYLWPGTGFPVNNFLGEADIHPNGFHQGPPGARFRTMMTPAIRECAGTVEALGTGGANRIRTAMLQVMHRLGRGETVEGAVLAPRMHLEDGRLDVEDMGQGDDWIAAAEQGASVTTRFEGRHLYFGGVHTAVRHADGRLDGVGDPRRSGVGSTV